MKTKLIAIQGIKGAFHEEAAHKVFGNSIEIVPCLSFSEATDKLAKGVIDYAIMAIENTISGTILNNYELIREKNLSIIGETYLHIKQNLGVIKGANLKTLKEVSSHYMALNQSRKYFEAHKHISLVESSDTASSLKEVSEKGSTEYGAVGSKLAIEYYGLEMLAESIETNKRNFTRFAVLSNTRVENIENRKVSLSIILPHQAGSLSKVLSMLHLLGINLTKIESSPVIEKPFQYRFYLDMILSDKVSFEASLEALKPLTEEVLVLGRYKAETIKYA